MSSFWHRSPVRWSAPVLWMGLIFYLSAQSHLPNLAPVFPGLQEIAGHLGVFAVLAWLWWRALRGAGVSYAAGWALLIAVVYGASDEYHQSFVVDRTPDIFDLAMDATGASVALLMALAWRPLRSRLALSRDR